MKDDCKCDADGSRGGGEAAALKLERLHSGTKFDAPDARRSDGFELTDSRPPLVTASDAGTADLRRLSLGVPPPPGFTSSVKKSDAMSCTRVVLVDGYTEQL